MEPTTKHAPGTFGRPTKYKPEYCQEIVDYFSGPLTELITKAVITKDGKVKEIQELKATPVKWLEDFAWDRGTSTKIMEEWAQRYPDFRAAYARAKDLQKRHLAQCTIDRLYEPMFAKFLAQNITDMRDRAELEHSGIIIMGGGMGHGRPKKERGGPKRQP